MNETEQQEVWALMRRIQQAGERDSARVYYLALALELAQGLALAEAAEQGQTPTQEAAIERLGAAREDVVAVIEILRDSGRKASARDWALPLAMTVFHLLDLRTEDAAGRDG